EMSNETAGEHYTPHDVIRLMAGLVFAEHEGELKGKGLVRSIFDPACGTGGMLTIAKEQLAGINPKMDVKMYGQELNDKTYAIAKMESHGSRIAIVFNGSPLFTGDAGSGESEIRRWIIENDWLEAVVAMPTELFYNTGIATYIWIVTNRKPKHRKGKVQLINAV